MSNNVKISTPSGVGGAILTVLWIMGIIIEKGFWLVLATMIFPPYGIYVSIQHLMKFFGVL